jgi:hypothetical protein
LAVPEVAPLLALLRGIRRRLRLWVALEGAVAGAAVGVILVAAAVVAAHAAGRPVGVRGPVALLVGGGALGALLRGVRRISLASCARFADAALDGQDRVLSALFLRDQETPLARALVIDAAARARTLAPGGAVAPRRPKGLPALAIGAIVLAAAAVVPVRTREARALIAPPRAPGVPLPTSMLDVERDEARRAAAAAVAVGDERLAQLAVELDGTLRRLAAGKISDGDALEQLAALQRRAAEAAQEAAREAQALAAAQKALAAEAATRGASEALSTEDGDAGSRARAALGAAASDNPKETARALSAAANGVSGALGDSSQGNRDGNSQRRLSRPEEKGADDGASGPKRENDGERRLERLQRDLGEASNACRDGDPSCRSKAEKSGDDLGRMAGRQASTESLRRLERSLRQMRERLGRGEMRGGDQSAMRGFERAAQGENGQQAEGQGQGKSQEGDGKGGDGVAGGEGSGEATADAQGQDGQDGKNGKNGKGGGKQPGKGQGGEALGEAIALIQEREAEGTSSTGDGQGNGAGGPPLGQRGDMQTRGHESEARVASGAGPNRAQVIGGAADRGFAQRGYARVFSDYQAAVEDALAASAVPEGRRYVVRRYFDLIRPRTGRTGKAER